MNAQKKRSNAMRNWIENDEIGCKSKISKEVNIAKQLQNIRQTRHFFGVPSTEIMGKR